MYTNRNSGINGGIDGDITHPTPNQPNPIRHYMPSSKIELKNRIRKHSHRYGIHIEIIHIMTDYRASVNHQKHEAIRLEVVSMSDNCEEFLLHVPSEQ